ncbi:MAG: glucose 1-dehydrogenase [Polyangiaceae bacterium]
MTETSASKPLLGQRAIVTGASSGIGAAIAKALAGAGATVVINWSRGEDAARRVLGEVERNGGHGLTIGGDVSREEDVQRLFRTAIAELGSVDILVNNAGMQRDAPLAEMTLADWNAVLGVNLTGQFLCSREAVREFRRRGLQPELSRALGKILCVSSVHDVIPWAGHANYAASKGGVSMLMRTMAQELARDGIRVNAISPGAIRTRINSGAWSTPDAEMNLLRLIPYGRVGDADDVAKAAVWLSSDASDYVNGATLYVDGGMTLYPEFRGNG